MDNMSLLAVYIVSMPTVCSRERLQADDRVSMAKMSFDVDVYGAGMVKLVSM